MTAPDAYTVMVDGIFSPKIQATWEPNEADALLKQSSWKVRGAIEQTLTAVPVVLATSSKLMIYAGDVVLDTLFEGDYACRRRCVDY